MFAFTILFLLLFLGLQFFFKSKKPVEPQPVQKQQQQQLEQAKNPGAALPAAIPAASAQRPEAGGVQAASESTTVVENELYRITFSNRGAQVTSWILKKYKDDDGKPFELVN